MPGRPPQAFCCRVAGLRPGGGAGAAGWSLGRRPEGGHRRRWQPTPSCPTCSPPCSHPAYSLPPPFIDHPGHLQRSARHIGPGVRKMSQNFRFTMGNFKNRLADTKRTLSLAHPLVSLPGPPGLPRAPTRRHRRAPSPIAAATAALGARCGAPAHPCIPLIPPGALGGRGGPSRPPTRRHRERRGAKNPDYGGGAVGATRRNSQPARPPGARVAPYARRPDPLRLGAARPPPAFAAPDCAPWGGLELSRSPSPAQGPGLDGSTIPPSAGPGHGTGHAPPRPSPKPDARRRLTPTTLDPDHHS